MMAHAWNHPVATRSLFARLARGAAAVLSVIVAVVSPVGAAVDYTYDEVGRLVGVYAPSGEAAQYVYDSAGNIVEIKRFSAGELAVVEFTPNRGAVGASVTIYGTGFSATVANNAVRFNGVAATISSATPTKLVAVVPASATTGRVTVTVGTTTATSLTDFIVAPNAGAPTITGFTPSVGVFGTAVTINGTNFDPSPASNGAHFNGLYSEVSASTASQLMTSVPAYATSGKIRVTTPLGATTSSADFFVPPGTLTAADVVATGRLAVNGASLPINIAMAGKVALVVFDGAAGDWLSLQFSGVTASSGTVSLVLYDPRGAVVDSASVNATALSGHLRELAMAGTYTVMLSAGTGTASFSLAIKSAPTLAVNGAAQAIPAVLPYQSARIRFAGTSGQNLGLAMTAITQAPASGYATSLYVYKPDRSLLQQPIGCRLSDPGPACQTNLSNLPATGNYGIVVVPPAGSVAGGSLVLSSDLTGTLANGTAVSVNIARAGQNARYTFSGTVGQLVGVQLAQLATVPATIVTYLTLRNPDGTVLATTHSALGANNDGAIVSATLPTTGTYSVSVDPEYAATAAFSLTRNPVGDLIADGASLNVSTTVPGLGRHLSFVATAGQNLGLGLRGMTQTPNSGYSNVVYVYKPDRTLLLQPVGCRVSDPDGGCEVNLTNLPQSGTYSVILIPGGGGTLAGTLTLSSDATGTLSSGVPSSVNLTRAGQNTRYTFSGSAGQLVGVQLAQMTTVPATVGGYLTLLKPDGTILATTSTALGANNDGAVLSATLPTAGTYTVVVDPAYGATASFTLTLNPAGDLLADGASLNVSTTVPGLGRHLSFVATAGQNLGLGLRGMTQTPNSGYSNVVYVYKPDRTLLLQPVGCRVSDPDGGCQVNLTNLPQSGTYSMILIPGGGGTLAGTLTLSSDAIGTLASGLPTGVNLTRAGQNARYTFSATAGETAVVAITNLVTAPPSQLVLATVLKPDGTQQASQSSTATGLTMNLGALATTGVYTLVIDPYYGATVSMTVVKTP